MLLCCGCATPAPGGGAEAALGAGSVVLRGCCCWEMTVPAGCAGGSAVWAALGVWVAGVVGAGVVGGGACAGTDVDSLASRCFRSFSRLNWRIRSRI